MIHLEKDTLKILKCLFIWSRSIVKVTGKRKWIKKGVTAVFPQTSLLDRLNKGFKQTFHIANRFHLRLASLTTFHWNGNNCSDKYRPFYYYPLWINTGRLVSAVQFMELSFIELAKLSSQIKKPLKTKSVPEAKPQFEFRWRGSLGFGHNRPEWWSQSSKMTILLAVNSEAQSNRTELLAFYRFRFYTIWGTNKGCVKSLL